MLNILQGFSSRVIEPMGDGDGPRSGIDGGSTERPAGNPGTVRSRPGGKGEPLRSALDLQRRHYSKSAERYQRSHASAADPHTVALRYIGALAEVAGVRSILDVGTGTGRGVRFFIDRGLRALGLDPIPEMLQVGRREYDLQADDLALGVGEALPFRDQSFDAAMELGSLHHLPNSERVVREMARVARRAVFLSDDNRFGRGGVPSRAMKATLHRLGLYDAVLRVWTGGKGYTYSEGDGVGYSYSVYDAYGTLGRWADRIFFIPTAAADPRIAARHHPFMSTDHVLLCALRGV